MKRWRIPALIEIGSGRTSSSASWFRRKKCSSTEVLPWMFGPPDLTECGLDCVTNEGWIVDYKVKSHLSSTADRLDQHQTTLTRAGESESKSFFFNRWTNYSPHKRFLAYDVSENKLYKPDANHIKTTKGSLIKSSQSSLNVIFSNKIIMKDTLSKFVILIYFNILCLWWWRWFL